MKFTVQPHHDETRRDTPFTAAFAELLAAERAVLAAAEAYVAGGAQLADWHTLVYVVRRRTAALTSLATAST